MRHELVKISKFLSYVLRHRPDAIGLALDEGGWAAVDELIGRAAAAGRRLDRQRLQEVVETNDKQRFVLSEDGQRIRASQGHSIAVDLGLQPLEPPQVLYHGTATRFLAAIREQGLSPRSRTHVHLSADHDTAVRVGQRHGKPVVLVIDAAAMHAAGFRFFLSENGVWLTESVPHRFLSVYPD